MKAPACTASATAAVSPASVIDIATRSIGTTASAPSGTGAPVMMRTAVPGARGATVPGAAAIVPTTGRARPPTRSFARTAMPSIWALRNGGRATAECTGPLSRRPSTASIGTVSVPLGLSPASSAATRA